MLVNHLLDGVTSEVLPQTISVNPEKGTQLTQLIDKQK